MLKALREKRAGIIKQIRSLADKLKIEGYEFTAEERQQFDALEADARKLEARIADIVRADELEQGLRPAGDEERDGGQPGRENRGGDNGRDPHEQPVTDAERAQALQAWCLREARRDVGEPLVRALNRVTAAGAMRQEGGELVVQLLNTMEHRRLRERRALGDNPMTVTTSAGGYMIPEGFVPDLERALLAFGNVMAVADVIRTPTGNDLPWPSWNDTAQAGEASTINTAVTADAKPTIGQLLLKAFKSDSKMIFVPFELMQDAYFNLASMLGEAIGERLGRRINALLTTGAGTTEPSGIVTGAYAGVTAASATAVTADELLTLLHSVDPAYRDPAYNCGWMMNDTTLLALKKIKDGQGRYLFPELRLPEPRHEGFPIFVNQQMASITNDAVPILFGAMRKFKVRMVGDIRIRRLDERYAELDQTAFIGFVRLDSGVLDAGTRPIKKLTMAS